MLHVKRPRIGINLDYQTVQTFSSYPWYALRQNYFDAISYHGGLPLALSYQTDLIDAYLDLIDGLIIPGGRFDIAPHYYGQNQIHTKTEPNLIRTQFEFVLCQQALKRNLPVLGICGGMQLLNIVKGGTLIQYIPDSVLNALNHDQENLRHKCVHNINIKEDSLLYKIYPQVTAQVNSSHRQAIKQIAPTGYVSATAPDGVIEAIEFPEYQFCLGVQWHPEFLITDLDQAIFKFFIQQAGNHV